MATMEYPYGLQEIVVDVPFLEERGFGSFSQLALDTNHHLQLPTALSRWSTTDPAIFQVNEQAAAWNSTKARLHPSLHHHPTCSTAGGVYDMCGPSSSSPQQHVVNVAQTNNCQQLIPLDIMQQQQQQQLPATSSSNNNNPNNAGDPSFPLAGEIYPWMHQMLLNHFMIQERCSSDQMPQLISDFSAQQPCLYTSSSECLQDADSSGSSGARDYTLPSSCVTACSSDEINWRNSDMVQGNNNFVPSSSTGFHIEELYDDSSSVAPIAGHHVDIADTNVAQSSSSSLSLVMQRNNARALIHRTPTVSWPISGAESDHSSVGAMAMNHCSTLDPLSNMAGFQDMGHGPSSSQPPPYKRPRLSHNSSPAVVENSTSCSRPLVSSLTHHRSMVGGGGGGSCSDYPMTSLNVADALYRDLHFSNRQQMSAASSLHHHHQQQQQQQHTGGGGGGILHEVSGGGVSGRYAPRKDSTSTLIDHDSSRTTLSRKHNATSIEPQSVAARHRRKKISERVRVLERLIPGGNKMDTASMLDEAIEYVKFLQLQVGLLEKLGELPESINNNANCSSRTQQHQQASSSSCLISNASAGASSSPYHGLSAAGVSRPNPTMPGRTTTSPLILSEILQQQLFKQKLCLVSLRQYPSGGSPSGSYA